MDGVWFYCTTQLIAAVYISVFTKTVYKLRADNEENVGKSIGIDFNITKQKQFILFQTISAEV